jgi:hypothetical protein
VLLAVPLWWRLTKVTPLCIHDMFENELWFVSSGLLTLVCIAQEWQNLFKPAWN